MRGGRVSQNLIFNFKLLGPWISVSPSPIIIIAKSNSYGG